MLPNMSIPPIDFFGLFEIEAFVVLAMIAVFTLCELSYRRAREIGLDTRIMVDGVLCTVATAIIVAHWVALAVYYPEQLLKNPLSLLMVWNGISAFGGVLGGFLGAFIYFRIKKVPLVPYLEAMLFGLGPAWIIGRLGCTIVFDHPGRATDFFLGMMDVTGVVRHNLGFYEMLLAIVLTAVLYALKKVRPFEGFHIVLLISLYAPIRIFLENLRISEITDWSLNFTQYFAIALLGLGAFLVIRGLRKRAVNPAALSR